MPTLLVLGSKPEPVLPPAAEYDALACANASGYSADRHGLPAPVLTAISAVVTSGIGSGNQSLKALHGLRTGELYRVPQFEKPRKLKKGQKYSSSVLKRLAKSKDLSETVRFISIFESIGEAASSYASPEICQNPLARKRCLRILISH